MISPKLFQEFTLFSLALWHLLVQVTITSYRLLCNSLLTVLLPPRLWVLQSILLTTATVTFLWYKSDHVLSLPLNPGNSPLLKDHLVKVISLNPLIGYTRPPQSWPTSPVIFFIETPPLTYWPHFWPDRSRQAQGNIYRKCVLVKTFATPQYAHTKQSSLRKSWKQVWPGQFQKSDWKKLLPKLWILLPSWKVYSPWDSSLKFAHHGNCSHWKQMGHQRAHRFAEDAFHIYCILTEKILGTY